MSAYDKLPQTEAPTCSTENPNDQIAVPQWIWNEKVLPGLQWLFEGRAGTSNSDVANAVGSLLHSDTPMVEALLDKGFEKAEEVTGSAEEMDNARVQPLENMEGFAHHDMDFAEVEEVITPFIRHDHGMMEGCEGPEEFIREMNGENVAPDEEYLEDPEFADYLSYVKWQAKLEIAKLIRPDLEEGMITYEHYLEGGGAPVEFDYDEFLLEDGAGRDVDASAIQEVKDAILERLVQSEDGLEQSFLLQTQPIGIGDPASENWQKAIGQHRLWLEASVSAVPMGDSSQFEVVADIGFHAEDRYNFNPGAQDLATGTPDDDNGRFQEVGLGHEFMQYGEARRTIEYVEDIARWEEVEVKRATEAAQEAEQDAWMAWANLDTTALDAAYGGGPVTTSPGDPLRLLLQQMLTLQEQHPYGQGATWIREARMLLAWPTLVAKTAATQKSVFTAGYAAVGLPMPAWEGLSRGALVDAAWNFDDAIENLATPNAAATTTQEWLRGLWDLGPPIPEAWYTGG